MSDLFVTPLPECLTRAVAIAQEAWNGEVGDAAEQAYKDQIDQSLTQTGMTLEELDQLGAPRGWIGRTIERVQDWWWERRHAADDPTMHDEFEALFAFPVPLLRTKPLQDTPYDYEEVDRMMAAVVEQIADAITSQTEWTPAAFVRPEADPDAFDFDPREYVFKIWRHPDGAALVLLEGIEDDPKLMGSTLGMVHLPAEAAAAFLR